jgi:trimeric autotransporter adhesin
MTGNGNTAIGDAAGSAITGDNNICIGSGVSGSSGESFTIRIGDNLPLGGSACYIGGIYGQTASGAAVLIDSSGKLSTETSSKRFNEDIKPMDAASEALFRLQPVAFHYKKDIDPTGTRQLGLVAEDVEKVNPDLVVRDKEGKPYSVRYNQINAMLLNEFLKEHRKVQEQQSEIDSLKAELKEQRDLIQKVSDRVEMTKPAELLTKNP